MRLSRRALLVGAHAAVVGGFVFPTSAFGAAPLAVELHPTYAWLAALARVAGFEEYNQAAFSEWTTQLDPLLKRVAHHPAVRMLQSARKSAGLGGDALPSLAAHLQGSPGALTLVTVLDPWPSALDSRWQSIDLPRFVIQANDAARRAGFTQLWADSTTLLEPIRSELSAATVSFDLAWIEDWFGVPAAGRVRIFAGLVEGASDYSAQRAGADPVVVAVLGSRADMARLVRAVTLSFVNPFVRAHLSVLRAPGERLYGAVRERMNTLHYGAWEAVVAQSLLRAFVARYLAAHGGAMGGMEEIGAQILAGFPWTLVLVDTLQQYEADRGRYPTLTDFATELAAVLTVIAGEEEDRATHRPRVVSIVPDPSKPVDPATRELVVTFDRAMVDRSWSFGGEPGSSPQLAEMAFDEARRVLTASWYLAPGRTYTFSLNGGPFRRFQSAEGVPLDPYAITFVTAKR